MQGSQYNRPTHRHNNFQPQNQYQKSFGSTESLPVMRSPFNMQANFSNVQGCDEFQPRGTTRVVYSDGTSATFSTNENFPSCAVPGTVISTDQKCMTYQQQQNFSQKKPFRHQNNVFRNQHYEHQNFVQRTQNQARFSRPQQGSKMKSHMPFRNFGPQNQNRRFKSKNFNYKMQRTTDFGPTGSFQQHESQDCQLNHCQVPNGVAASVYPNMDACRVKSENLKSENSVGGMQTESKFKNTTSIHFPSSNKDKIIPRKNEDKCNETKGKRKLLQAKVKVDYDSRRGSPHSLSYDDVSENSDENDDCKPAVREQLLHKKNGVVVKREPGEIDSDDDSMWDENISKKITPNSNQEKSQSKSKSETVETKAKRSAFGRVSSDSEICKSKMKKSGSQDSSSSAKRTKYSCHDDRCAGKKTERNEVEGRSDEIDQSPKGSHTFCRSSSYNNKGSGKRLEPSKGYCCHEAEVADLRERIGEMKQSLRKAQDELLETTVIGSKKSLRLQSEIDQLRTRIADKDRLEGEMNVSLKKAQDELAEKATELTKWTLLFEAEKQEHARVQTDLSRTYQDRLIIETEKLRALFDVEVAKMQAYYMQG